MTLTSTVHETFIESCYRLATQAVGHGNHPFGALLVVNGEIRLTSENTVNTACDVTGHAELNLVRQASSQFTPDQLASSTLYTSTEPCAMCSGAIYWSGISQIVYGCSAAALAAIAGSDFLIPCREIFAYGQRTVTVIGPVLEAEGVALHRAYWHNASLKPES